MLVKPIKNFCCLMNNINLFMKKVIQLDEIKDEDGFACEDVDGIDKMG